MDSMPHGCQAIVQANGFPTKYYFVKDDAQLEFKLQGKRWTQTKVVSKKLFVRILLTQNFVDFGCHFCLEQPRFAAININRPIVSSKILSQDLLLNR
jgi:hypothetical protein